MAQECKTFDIGMIKVWSNASFAEKLHGWNNRHESRADRDGQIEHACPQVDAIRRIESSNLSRHESV